MPQINLDPFVHPRPAVQSIRLDSAERWPLCVGGNVRCLHVWSRYGVWLYYMQSMWWRVRVSGMIDGRYTLSVALQCGTSFDFPVATWRESASLICFFLSLFPFLFLLFLSSSLLFLSLFLFLSLHRMRHGIELRMERRTRFFSDSKCIADPTASRQGRSLIYG